MSALHHILIDEAHWAAGITGGAVAVYTALWAVDRLRRRGVEYRGRHDHKPEVFAKSAYNTRVLRDAREARTTREILTEAARAERERQAAYEQWYRSVYRALPAGTALDRPIEALNTATSQYPVITPTIAEPEPARELVAA